MASRGLHYKVDLGQGKAIFRASQINIGKVNAESRQSLLTSSLIAFCLSGVKLLIFCFTGLTKGATFSLWVITAGSIPPMSSCFKANTSTFFFKRRMRRSLTWLQCRRGVLVGRQVVLVPSLLRA